MNWEQHYAAASSAAQGAAALEGLRAIMAGYGAATLPELARRIYKDTACGATLGVKTWEGGAVWGSELAGITPGHVRVLVIGTIIEGSDAEGTAPPVDLLGATPEQAVVAFEAAVAWIEDWAADSDGDDDDDGDKITISVTFEVVDPGGEEQNPPEVVSRGFCSENDTNFQVDIETVFTENGQEYRVGSPRWGELAGTNKKYSRKEGMDEIRRLLRENSGEWGSGHPRPGDAFYTHGEQDIHTGRTTSYGFHFEGLTPEQWASLRKK
jgi:hypothetical protein